MNPSNFHKPAVHPGIPTQPGKENYHTQTMPALRSYTEAQPYIEQQARQLQEVRDRFCVATGVPLEYIRDFTRCGIQYRALFQPGRYDSKLVGTLETKRDGLMVAVFNLYQLENLETENRRGV